MPATTGRSADLMIARVGVGHHRAGIAHRPGVLATAAARAVRPGAASEEAPRRDGPRPPQQGGGGGGARGNFRRDDRGGNRGDNRQREERREPMVPLPDLMVTLMPDDKGVDSISRQIKMSGRSFPLFDIAQKILQ